MHNTTDYDKLSAEKQNAVEFKYESQDLVPMNNEKPEAVVLKGQANINLGLEQSLADLKVITNGNKNLSTLQKNFFVKEIGKVQSELKITENINEIIQKANEINLQIQLIQARKAIESGFLAEEVNKNLKEAESTIKDLKEVIKDEKLEKSLDEISTEVFWESLKLGGVTWLTSLNESIKEWRIVNDINKDLSDKINGIVQKAQTEYISKELTKLEQERKSLIELGDKILSGHESGGATQFSYGDPKLDPPVVLIDERMYKLKHIFDEKQLTVNARLKEEMEVFKNEYEEAISSMNKEKILSFWNKLTEETENAYTKERKWRHLTRWEESGQNQNRPLPYYIRNYNEYIKPNRKEIQSVISYELMKANALLKLRKDKFKEEDMKKILPYLKDEETGLYWYAGLLSPISLEDNSNIALAAHEGSRYLGSEGPEYYYRLHAGQDIGSTLGGEDIKDMPVHSLINGTALLQKGSDLVIEQENGYAIRYRHMPPSSYSQYKTGDKISTNEVVGKVGNYKTIPYHLHYEILKGTPIMNADKSQQLNRPGTNIPEYIYNIVLDPSKVIIKRGKVYEKK